MRRLPHLEDPLWNARFDRLILLCPKTQLGAMFIFTYGGYILAVSPLSKVDCREKQLALIFSLNNHAHQWPFFFCPSTLMLYLSRAFDLIDVISAANYSLGCSKQHQHPKSHSRCQKHQIIHSHWQVYLLPFQPVKKTIRDIVPVKVALFLPESNL